MGFASIFLTAPAGKEKRNIKDKILKMNFDGFIVICVFSVFVVVNVVGEGLRFFGKREREL